MGLICEKSDWNSEYYYDANLNERIISKDYSDTSIVLPTVNVETVLIDLSETEMKRYDFVMERLKNEYTQFKKGISTFSAPLAMFIRLRQVCVDSQMIPEDFFSELGVNVDYSTKIAKAVEIIQNNLKNGEKIIVFSSFVKGLNSLSKVLKSLKIKSLQLDGTVTGVNRELLIKKFETSGKYNVFLSSYKTGGVGINLTCGSVVILLEPWWNSSTEEQAISRSHRIGQTKPVTVYSLIAENTFESYLLQTQKKKIEIINEYFKGYRQKYRSFDSVVMRKLIEHIVYSNKKATQDAVSKK
jgi:SNF2 family DNA or RNA helicase